MRLLLLLLLLLITMFGISYASHDKDYSWMGWCCGVADCVQASVSIVKYEKDTAIVLVNGQLLELPARNVRESEDGHTYWCAMRVVEGFSADNTRCVFYTIGS